MGSNSGSGGNDGGQQRSTSGNADGSDGQTGGDNQNGGGQSGSQGASTVEKGVTVVSVAFTLLLFAHVGWQMVVPPQTTTPQVSVGETEPMANGSVAVTVRLRNPANVGLITATVQSNCSSPPQKYSSRTSRRHQHGLGRWSVLPERQPLLFQLRVG